jgi:sigma-B regulation protein RsbQ
MIKTILFFKKFKIMDFNKTISIAALLTFSLLSCQNNDNAKSVKDTKSIKEMKEIMRDNAVINYQITGTGDTTLLFVHGSYIDQTYWENQVNYFSPNYTVVTLDLPGHGKSGTERTHWTVQGFAEDVSFIIKELNLKNVILIGHSLGGDINLIVATSHPENIIGFIGIDNFKNAATPLSIDYQKQAVEIEKKLKTDFANTNEQYAKMALLTRQTSTDITKRVINDYRNAFQPMAIETTPEIFKIFEIEKRLLPQLKFKLHLINVDYMPINEVSLKQYSGNGYDVLHIKGTCHYPMLENPDGLNKLLQQTIRKI